MRPGAFYRALFINACGLTITLVQIVACREDTRQVTLAGLEPGFSNGAAGGAGAGAAAGRIAASQLSVEPAALDFGAAVTGLASRARVSVANAGDAPLSLPHIELQSGSNPDFSVLHNQCDQSLEPGASCDVRIQLLPSKPGPSSATLSVVGDTQTIEVALTASGLSAGPLTVAPAAGFSADFGGVTMASTLEAQFDVANPTANSSGPLSFSVNDSQFQLLPPSDGGCQSTTTLVGGQSCRLRVAYTPTRRAAVDASLIVTAASLGSSTLPLAGLGRQPATLSAPGTLDFGSVVLGGAGRRTLHVDNKGDQPLTLAGVAVAGVASSEPSGGAAAPAGPGPAAAGGSVFSVQESDCGGGKVLAGGESCHVTLAFRPLAAQPDQQAQLIVSTADGVQQPVGLTGSGLNQGALSIAAAPGSSADFGPLRIGDSVQQSFVVTNPSAQPSGPLDIGANDDFVVTAADGDCRSGVTSLVNGESCSITVALTPTERGQHDGGLTVASALAGAVNLPLTGRGLIAPRLALARSEVDFGRVSTQTRVTQSLTVLNTGDQPVSPVQASIDGSLAFSIQNSCQGGLSPNASCNIEVDFLPTDATSYAAVLHLSGDPGGTTSALLSGQAFARGSLVLSAVEGTGEFGDVVLGTPSKKQFNLTNPSSTASGRLTLTVSNPLFTVDAGDCNPPDGAGFANGASCTFSVAFSPTASGAVAANLSVQSPGAGETDLPLSGTGRAAAHLSAAGNRDFGLATVNPTGGNQAAADASNLFTWTVTNDGDLSSGTLQLSNGAAGEFVVSNDTCSNASVPGHGSCQLNLQFRPSATGARSANLTLTDPTSMQLLSLALTGTGQIIAQLGQSCLSATCAAGVCTAGVCCDRACTNSCQACSAAGVCTDQSNREACGNGSGRCFGVDQCLLPELQACTGDEQCGAHNCELRLGGQGPNDRICCLDDCGNTGQQCNPQTGHCQVPALGQGAACGAAGQAACGNGLECKQCLGGGTQCTPTDGCCNGCAAGYTCINGACGCPMGSNGRAQIDCGNGQCILNQALACCASAPQCPAADPVCDGRAGVCRQCLAASDCPPGPQGTRASCNNFTCSYACNTQQGLKDCGNNRCVAQASCCGNADCGPCSVCNNNGTCQSQCTNGQICLANNTCGFATVGLGQTCDQQANNCNAGLRCGTTNTCQCANNTGQCGTQCFNLSSDSTHCGNCNVNCGNGFACVNGTCNCGTDREQIVLSDPRNQTGPACLLFDGFTCTSNAQCSSNTCTEFFLDLDGDGFGTGRPGQGQKICGLFGPAQSVGTLVDRSGDCCDLRIDGASDVHPGATTAVTVPADCQAQGVAATDFTCAAFNR